MKKVISFVLVLALVLGSFSMAFAAPATEGLTDVAGDANETAIKVVNDLGIVTGYTDGSFQPAKAVTRAEFAAMITRALDIPESALAGYTTSTFKDTTGYGWAVKYLAFCNDKGIMLGDGNGNAMPGATITVNQAMSMALRAIGLTDNSAFLTGSWPANYVTVAKAEGLYTDVKAAELVDRASAAQIIYNVIKCDSYVVNADGDTSTAAAIINNLVDSANDEIVAYTTATLVPLAEYMGAYATVYRVDGDIVAVDPMSTFMTGDWDATANTFTVDEVEYDVATATDGALYGVLTNGTRAVTSPVPVTSVEGITLAVDYVGKTITEVYSAVNWNITEAIKAADDVQEDIADDFTLGTTGDTFAKDENGEIKAGSYQLFGAKALTDIEEDDVVYIYTNGTNIVKVEVGTDVVTGKVTKIYDDEGTTTYAIGGAEYVDATTQSALTEAIVVGETGTGLLDYNGDIYEWTVDEGTTGNYAVLVDAAVDSSALFDDATVVVKLFTKEGEMITPALDMDKVTTIGSITTGSVIEYSLDKNGDVDAIATTAAVFGGSELAGATVADNGALIDNYKVSKDIIIFTFDGTDWALGKVADLQDTITAGAIIDTGVVELIVIDTTYTGTVDDTFGLVTKYNIDLLDADGEAAKAANIIIEGAAKTDVIYASGVVTSASVSVGDATALKVIKIDADGNIESVEAANGTYAVTSGITVAAIDGNMIKATNNAYYQIVDGATVYVYDTDGVWSVGKVSKGDVVYLYDTDDVSGSADGVYDVIVAIEQ